VGKGRSRETWANLRNLTGDGLLLRAGRFDLSDMKPGEVRQVAMTFDVLDQLAENFAKLELSVVDRDLKVISNEKLQLPVTKHGLSITAASGAATLAELAPVRGQPANAARIVGEIAKGSIVEKVGVFGEYTKVKVDGDRFGFVETRLLRDGGGAPKVAFTPLLSRSPPMLEVKPAALATRGDKVLIEGFATDGDRVLDAYVFVGSHKVFYQSNRKGQDSRRLEFRHEAALQPGINVVTVVARETEETATRYTMVVRRDGANGEALPTPKSESFAADWEFIGDE
jgi:carboxyl-terminal processing protease